MSTVGVAHAGDRNTMKSRREILKRFGSGAVFASLPANGYAETEDIDDCQLHASMVASSMKRRYGGEWAVTIKPEYGFVVIVRD